MSEQKSNTTPSKEKALDDLLDSEYIALGEQLYNF